MEEAAKIVSPISPTKPNPFSLSTTNPDGVRKHLPHGAARCIITSRFTEFGDIAQVTHLDKWPDDVTRDYLLLRTGRNDVGGALRLAKTLEGLPLAAEQTAAFLKTRAGISFDDYTLGHLEK